jgi:hypothetical protein
MYTPTSTIARNKDATDRNSQMSDIDIHDLLHPEDPQQQGSGHINMMMPYVVLKSRPM